MRDSHLRKGKTHGGELRSSSEEVPKPNRSLDSSDDRDSNSSPAMRFGAKNFVPRRIQNQNQKTHSLKGPASLSTDTIVALRPRNERPGQTWKQMDLDITFGPRTRQECSQRWRISCTDNEQALRPVGRRACFETQRRGWDLNPRYPCGYTGFRVQHNRPLCHLSGFSRATHHWDVARSGDDSRLPSPAPSVLLLCGRFLAEAWLFRGIFPVNRGFSHRLNRCGCGLGRILSGGNPGNERDDRDW